MKVAVLASREFSDSNLIEDTLDKIHSERKITLLLTPKELPAGMYAGDWAFIHKVETEERMINWKVNQKKKAGSARNAQMISDSDYCIVYYADSPECDWILDNLEQQNKPFYLCKKNSESQ
jgi:hypothetical protein